METRDNQEARKLLANPHLLKVRAKEAVKDLKDFQIPIIYTHSFSGVSGDNLNRTISCKSIQNISPYKLWISSFEQAKLFDIAHFHLEPPQTDQSYQSHL